MGNGLKLFDKRFVNIVIARKTKTDFKDRGSLEHKSKDKYTLSCTFMRQCCCILYCGNYELNQLAIIELASIVYCDCVAIEPPPDPVTSVSCPSIH